MQELERVRVARRDPIERELEDVRLHQPPATREKRAHTSGTTYAYDVSGSYAEVAPKALAKAAGTYMVGVFILTYALLPMIAERFDLFGGILTGLGGNFRAFLAMLGLVVAGVLIFKPKIRVPRFGSKHDADPWLAATSGSLMMWAAIHNIHPMLRHFVDMTGTELATFVAMNVVESALFGMMLASLVRTQRSAFLLGGAFSATFLSLALWFF